MNTTNHLWPELPLSQWEGTRDTLQLWTQMVGKVRMSSTPLINHWWNVPLYVSAQGFTTSLMQHPEGGGFQIDFDVQQHVLRITTVAGARRKLPLRAGPVSTFFAEFLECLVELDLRTDVWPMPVEIADAVPFTDDFARRPYDPDHARAYWLALTMMVPILERFRSRFLGKASPVHLFWGALDLATTRFSGRTAPPHPGGAPNTAPYVMLEAYSHEVSSCGYWPGGATEGLFYSYAYPQPNGYADWSICPEEAYWSEEFGEFCLPYEAVRTATAPDEMLLAFLQSSYEAAATNAGWQREQLERGQNVPQW
jgi:uncharacterized protein DUF5996